MARLVGLAALFAAGLLTAGLFVSTGVADITTTETVPLTTTVSETTTEPAQTVVTTVEHTTTEQATTPTTGTTTSAASESTTPTWVWVVLAILAAAVIGLAVALLMRRGGIPPAERQRRLDAAVASWAAQGWALVNQTAGSATMSRGSDVMVVSVDDHGQVDARSVARP
ncbi:MAG TPA: hypothetical protein VFU30_00780 [Gaiellaceae bacterium]|nr:hypothetical protein [Gaiellaceae bacterium]